MEQIRRTGLVTFFIITVLLFIPFTYVNASERRIVYFFYNNPCASCKEEDKIYDLYKKEFSEEERRSLNYELRAVNLFEPSDKKFYEEICTAQEKDADQVELPVLVAGSRWVSGYSEIADNVRDIMEDSSWSTAQTSGAADSETPEDIRGFEDKLSSISKDNSRNSILFVTTACSDCEEAKELLNEAVCAFTSLNIVEGNNYQGLSALLYAYGIDEKKWKVPCLFLGDAVCFGTEEIEKATGISEESVADYNTDTAHILMEKLDEYEAEESDQAKPEKGPAPWCQLLAEGILVGLNPCMISMLIMLLSVLITAGKSVFMTG
jgi:glutaredoxin